LGFPTANLNPHHEVIPPHGVYAVRAIVAGREHPAACYIGGKPKFLRRRRHKRLPFANIEVHIPGFRKKIYGQLLEVRFLRKVREERHFPSPQELVTQIKKDLRRIRAILPSPY
jgi:riboflavin kinase/FMN adenylyltransferase